MCHDSTFELIHEDGQLPNIGSATGVQHYSGSGECLKIAAQWLADCLDDHILCRGDKNAGLPSRVIDLGIAEEIQPRLTDKSAADDVYIALSYCWGEDATLTTTRENISAHMTDLKFASLPRVYRDLMWIARALKVRYVWIDALCIVQDNAQDWAAEAAKMSSIYENAHLTVSADCSPSVHYGIFSEQSYATPPSVLSYMGVPISIRASLQRKHTLHDPFDNVDFDNLEAPVPLYRRAWCLQETVLSTRALHFTGKELMWECNEAYKCECRNQKMGQLEMSNRAFRKPEILGHATQEEFFDKWRALLEAYTARGLGRDSDKFPAISGLAKKMQQVIHYFTGEDDVYLAGLWKSNLAQDLLWQRQIEFFHTDPTRGRPQEWRAPSWSWASINGPVNQNHNMGLVSRIKLIDYECIPLSDDMTGQIRSAWIVLQGRVVRVNIERIPVANSKRQRDRLEGFQYRVRCVRGGEAHGFIPDDHAACFDDQEEYLCLHVASREERGFSQQFFLILRSSTEDPIAFERVGVSDGEEAWDFAQYRQKAGRLFDGAQETAVKLL